MHRQRNRGSGTNIGAKGAGVVAQALTLGAETDARIKGSSTHLPAAFQGQSLQLDEDYLLLLLLSSFSS